MADMQAQTVANFYLAFDMELAIVPVLNKIDLPAADPEKVAEQVQQVRTLSAGKLITLGHLCWDLSKPDKFFVFASSLA